MTFQWNWQFTWEIMPRLLEATLMTLAATSIGFAIALVAGLAFALMQRFRFSPLATATREFMEFIRSTPLLLQVFFVFFVGPEIGIRLSPWVSGLLTLGLYHAAFLSEVYRGGLDAVPSGQWEACKALNLSTRDAYWRIIIPQALPLAIAGIGNDLIGMFKNTPLLSVIGVAELMHVANSIGSENYRYLEPYTIAGFIYLVTSLPTAALLRFAENRMRHKAGVL